MGLSFHINFNGQCRAAFEYYAQNLGGIIGTMLSYKDSPAAASAAHDWQDKILHANINIAGVELAGADLRPEDYQKPRGFYVLLGINSAAEVNSIFNALCLDGTIILAPQKTFWSKNYAIVVDRFGVPWKINCGD